MKTGQKVALAAGAVAVVGGVAWLATRPAQAAGQGGGGGAEQTGTLELTVSPAETKVLIAGTQIPPGTYTGVATGSYSWTASADGYQTATGTITVKANQNNPLNIVLVPVSGGGGGGGGGGSAAPFQMIVKNASSYQSWPDSVWNAIKISVEIKNTGQPAQNHTITVWRSYTVNGQKAGPFLVMDSNGANLGGAVILDAGMATTLNLDSGRYSVVFPYGYSATCDLWVQDEKGNKSNVLTIS
jgi:hypothetical protein